MSIYHDSELMQQVVTSTPLTDTSAFYVVRDELLNPLLFSIGSDGILYVTKQDGLGRNQLINLSEKFRLPSQHKTTALGLHQADDLTLRVAFAHGDGQGVSTLVVLDKIKPQDLLLPADTMVDTILKGEALSQHVYGLLVAKGADDSHPLIVAKLRNLEGNQDDICRIDVNNETASWSVKTDLEMPCNPRDIISLTPATLPGGGPEGKFGLFVLYQSGAERRIIFTGMGGKSGFYTHIQYNIPVPPGAADVATVKNSKGRTDLLIAAQDGIHRIPARTCVSGSTKLPNDSLVAQAECLRNLEQIHTAQDGPLASIWTRNSGGDIVYVQFESKPTATVIDSFEPRSDAQPVLTGTLRFAAMIDARSTSQRLFVLGDEKHEKMRELFQSGDSKLWTTTNFCVPAIETPREIWTYTTHIKIKAGKGRRPFDGTVDLSASSHCVATVNGRNLHLGCAAVKVKPDALGTITVIQEIDDLNVSSLKVVGVPGCETTFIDPGRKVLQFFQSIKSADDLKNVRLPNGEKLISDNASASVDLDGAAKALSTLTSRAASLEQEAQFEEEDVPVESDGIAHDDEGGLVNFASVDDIQASSWASFDWLTSATKTVVKVVVEGWNIVVTVGKTILRFVIKTFQHILKGIKKVFQLIGTGLKKLWEGLKWLFNWGDILDTHNIYRDCLEGFLDVTVGGVLFMGNKVDGFLDGIEESIKAKFELLEKLPSEADEPVGEESAEAETDDSKKLDRAVNSPGGNSLQYQTQHNPEVKQSVASVVGDIPPDDPLSVVWKALKSLLDEFWKGGKNIAESFVELFNPSRKATIGEIVSKLGGELLLNLIHVVRILIKTVFEVGASIIVSIKKLLTAEINIPVISWLWGKISDRPLSVIDAFCLLIAVPGTIAFKAITGEAPKKHASFQGMKDSKEKLDKTLQPLLQPHITDSKPRVPDLYAKKGFWEKVKDAFLEIPWVQALLDFVDKHAIWLGIGFGIYNTVMLVLEWGSWAPEVETEMLGEEKPNPNYNLDPDQSRWPSGLRWGKWSLVAFLFGAAISFPYNTKLPSWPLRLIDWGFSWLGVLKHAVNQRLRGIMTVFLSAVQTLTYTACWIWDLGDANAESLWVILNTYLTRAHDILSGIAMTQTGANIYVNIACSGCGGAATAIGIVLKTQTVHSSIAHFVIRST
ncbi:hypothetical protein F4808DRAFT_471052 [Astrocystis sublimbata]|nr:hypothetical protein F4808DRAFT_471052 [Astrocystis sublimbata]